MPGVFPCMQIFSQSSSQFTGSVWPQPVIPTNVGWPLMLHIRGPPSSPCCYGSVLLDFKLSAIKSTLNSDPNPYTYWLHLPFYQHRVQNPVMCLDHTLYCSDKFHLIQFSSRSKIDYIFFYTENKHTSNKGPYHCPFAPHPAVQHFVPSSSASSVEFEWRHAKSAAWFVIISSSNFDRSDFTWVTYKCHFGELN